MITVGIDGRDGLHSRLGQHLGFSGWRPVTQDEVDCFGAVIGNRHWTHTDPERSAGGPFGGTIVHGSLTLAIAVVLLDEVIRVVGASNSVLYGLGRTRFPAPLPVGGNIRVGVELSAVGDIPGGFEATYGLVCEVQDRPKPACVVDVIHRYYR